MESAKIPHHHHHHQVHLQDHQILGSSATLDYYPPAFAAPPSSHSWTSNTILNSNGDFDSFANVATIHSRNPRFEQHDVLVSSPGAGSIAQDLSFNWPPANTVGNKYTNNLDSVHERQLSRFKRELSNSCPNLGGMINSPSSSIEDVQLEPTGSYGKNDPNVKLLFSTLSSGGQNNNGFQSCPEELICSTLAAATPKRGTFSQIYPTINVSNLSQSSSLANSAGSFDMNLRALDLLNSASLGGDFRHSSLQDQLGNMNAKNAHYSSGYDYVKPSIQRSSEPGNTAGFSHGVAGEEKRSKMKSSSEAKEAQAAAQKRSRLESSRPSCQPFKVRKEKLGDRIAALQQLVAPFGKTDTASVLMEAIGYIKFLQNQVETLSVPYLKSSRNKAAARSSMHGGSEEARVHGNEERQRDLGSRGLCLVPMSCLSYMTDAGGSVWPPPPNFGGGGGT